MQIVYFVQDLKHGSILCLCTYYVYYIYRVPLKLPQPDHSKTV